LGVGGGSRKGGRIKKCFDEAVGVKEGARKKKQTRDKEFLEKKRGQERGKTGQDRLRRVDAQVNTIETGQKLRGGIIRTRHKGAGRFSARSHAQHNQTGLKRFKRLGRR